MEMTHSETILSPRQTMNAPVSEELNLSMSSVPVMVRLQQLPPDGSASSGNRSASVPQSFGLVVSSGGDGDGDGDVAIAGSFVHFELEEGTASQGFANVAGTFDPFFTLLAPSMSSRPLASPSSPASSASDCAIITDILPQEAKAADDNAPAACCTANVTAASLVGFSVPANSVICREGRIVALAVTNPQNPQGKPLTSSMGNLTALEHLDLQLALPGPIPASIGLLSNLRYLKITYSQLTGPIPPELGNLRNLESLSMNNNAINSRIPSVIGNLRNLTKLDDRDFASNNLEGVMPPELGNLVNLEYLNLCLNSLSGQIPVELANLRYLENMVVEMNCFTGFENGTTLAYDSTKMKAAEECSAFYALPAESYAMTETATTGLIFLPSSPPFTISPPAESKATSTRVAIIAGGVAGLLVLLAVCGVAAFVALRRRRRRRQSTLDGTGAEELRDMKTEDSTAFGIDRAESPTGNEGGGLWNFPASAGGARGEETAKRTELFRGVRGVPRAFSQKRVGTEKADLRLEPVRGSWVSGIDGKTPAGADGGEKSPIVWPELGVEGKSEIAEKGAARASDKGKSAPAPVMELTATQVSERLTAMGVGPALVALLEEMNVDGVGLLALDDVRLQTMGVDQKVSRTIVLEAVAHVLEEMAETDGPALVLPRVG
ncbi:hypothetical protein HDU96_001435 [Phlyctochytrium bullatum]|nr:hypothetical protein HDU96_001435 [Phlyctochytrium bullatum]